MSCQVPRLPLQAAPRGGHPPDGHGQTCGRGGCQEASCRLRQAGEAALEEVLQGPRLLRQVLRALREEA
eukprot:8015056-Pyramimonas_sp.AAC.1